MGVYVQFYNLKVDEKTHKNNVSMDMKITNGQQQVVGHETKTGEDMQQNGEQITVQRVIAAKSLPPGKYTIELKATDQLANTTITRTAEFTVTPPANDKVAVNGATGR